MLKIFKIWVVLGMGVLLLGGLYSCHRGEGTAHTSTEPEDSTTLPSLTDEELLDTIQRATFRYFWEGAEPNSGMARERIHMDGIYPQNDKDVVTTGGSGFGLMALLVGIKRGYISREEAFERFDKIVTFLEKADRFHGVWPHWLDGQSGKVKPFSQQDDGGDLVETSFLIQGLLSVKQYLQDGEEKEKELADRIDVLWRDVDWQWYTRGEQVLYWHWSPTYEWQMNFPIHGYNECLLTYILAASSPTHPVSPEVYQEGWAENGKIKQESTHFGYTLQLRRQGDAAHGGPLFWAHYSYLGLSPKGLKDQYADYWKENVNQTLINYSWCVENPKRFKGYGEDSWGLTASYSVDGYAAHAPGEESDLGVIAPTAAVSSIPYTPDQSLEAMHAWYEKKNDKLWGSYGFYDAFSETNFWFPQKYLAIDQGPQVVMIENYRSGMLWDLFMSNRDVRAGLKKLGFESPYLE